MNAGSSPYFAWRRYVSDLVFTRRAVLALFVIALCGVLAIHPTLAQSLGVDVWNVSTLKAQLRATETENVRLAAEDEEVRDRIAIKEGLITDLIAHRTTLAEVTEQFIVLDASRPRYLEILRRAYPATTDREVMARNVIAYTLPRVAPEERAAVSSRLEADLQQMLSHPIQ
jgi:hypothetical protein